MSLPRLALLLALLGACASSARAGYVYLGDIHAYIEASGQTVIGTASTYEAVMLFKAVGGSGMIMEEIEPFGEDKFFEVDPASGVYGFDYPVNNPNVLAGPVSNISLDTWHHAAYVYDGAEERLYFDGMLVGSRSASGDVSDAAGLAYIGASLVHGYTTFVGLLDSVRVSDVARYVGTSFVPPIGDLTSDANTLLLYNFDDPAGSTTVTDSSPLNRTGTLGALSGTVFPVLCGNDPTDVDGDLIPDACDPDVPTTSTTTTISSTTAPTTSSTSSSSTTGAPTTSTSTTLAGCAAVADGPTFASVTCRIQALLTRVNAESRLGTFQPKLAHTLMTGHGRAIEARDFCAASKAKKSKGRLQQVGRALIQYVHRLAGLPARKKLDDALRREFLDAGTAIEPHVGTLRQDLHCPADAGG